MTRETQIANLCDHIATNAGSIAVREQIDGKWGSHFLTELPVELAIKHVLRFVKEERVPFITNEEDNDNQGKMQYCPVCGEKKLKPWAISNLEGDAVYECRMCGHTFNAEY